MAPKCNYSGGCGNRTWNDSGLCHQHRASTSGSSIPFAAGPPSAAAHRGSGSADEIFASVRHVLPETPPDQSPRTIRRQALLSLRTAAAVEARRRFPDTNLPDSRRRLDALKRLHRNTVEICHPVPVTLSDDQAAMLARSSSDEYGMALEDSAGLAAWCLRKEWELGRAQGIDRDEAGISYLQPYESFCEAASRVCDQTINDELVRQLVEYPQIIRAVTGRPPVSQEPIFEGQDMLGGGSEVSRRPAMAEVARRPAAARSADSRPRQATPAPRRSAEAEFDADQDRRRQDRLARRERQDTAAIAGLARQLRRERSPWRKLLS